MRRPKFPAISVALAIGLARVEPVHAQVPLTHSCITYVAGLYALPVPALDGLRAAEGGRVGKVTTNRNGSVDIGPFQVNSTWVRYFKAAWNRSTDDETTRLLRDDGCANALAAAAIFRIALDQAHGDVGVAVGLYNSPNDPVQADTYRRHFIDAFRRGLARRALELDTVPN